MYYHSTYLYYRNFELRSGTSSLASRPMLGDCLDHSPTTAWGLRRSLLDLCSGTASTTARGLRRSLLDLCSGTASTTLRPRLGDFASRLHATGNSHTVGDILSHLDLATSKLGDYIGTMHLPVHLVSPVRRLDSQLNWEFFLDPGTTCLRYLLPGSGTKWTHFTLR